MTQEQLQDALGMIDDDLIESVDKLRLERESSTMPDRIFHSFRKKIIQREIYPIVLAHTGPGTIAVAIRKKLLKGSTK